MPLFALSSIFLLAITFSPSRFGNPANFGTFRSLPCPQERFRSRIPTVLLSAPRLPPT